MIEYEVISSPRGDVPNVQPGDIGLVHDWKEDWVGELIQAGERATYGHTAWSNITHSFAVMDNTGVISEANAPGVQYEHIGKYKDADLHIVRPKNVSLSQLALCIRRWHLQVGKKYGYATFVGLAFNALTRGSVVFQVNEELICSAHVSYGMLAYETDLPVPYQTMKPADIGTMTGLDLGEPPMPLSFWGRCLDKLRLVSNLLSRPFR
jgi:hypothetical protein